MNVFFTKRRKVLKRTQHEPSGDDMMSFLWQTALQKGIMWYTVYEGQRVRPLTTLQEPERILMVFFRIPWRQKFQTLLRTRRNIKLPLSLVASYMTTSLLLPVSHTRSDFPLERERRKESLETTSVKKGTSCLKECSNERTFMRKRSTTR